MHRWFDKLKEPKRFFIFFIPTCVLITGVYVPFPVINYISIGLLLALLGGRLIHLRKGKTT